MRTIACEECAIRAKSIVADLPLDHLSTTETAVRLLAQLKRKRAIDVQNRQVIVIDLAKLQRLANRSRHHAALASPTARRHA